jgi:hypothetical protein
LGTTDPDGRLATLSCGAAPHHARTALAAQGWHADVLRLPDPTDPSHLTRTRVTERVPVTAILHGHQDSAHDWLRAGEALSAAWLTATKLGVSLLPLSATVEVAATRAVPRRLLSGLGQPYLVLRLGLADPNHAGPPHPPRLPAEQTIERG